MSTTTTAIVLLSYNSLPLIKQFLPKIISTTQHLSGVEIVLVDNASTDDTFDYVSTHFKQVRIIQIQINQGFTGGYVNSLHQIKADNYVLISSDIEVTEGWLEQGLNLLNSSDNIAAVQPKVMSYHMREKLEYAGAAGGFIDFLGYPFCRGRIVNELEVDQGQYDEQIDLFWASGACLFIKSKVYHAAGGLDNDFYAHMEEIDLCWRLHKMGYRIVFQPKSVVYHMGGYIISYGSKQKVYRNHRNNLVMLIKNLPANELIWKLPVRFAMDAITFYKMAFDGEIKSAVGIIKAHFEIVFHWKKWYGKRKQVQAITKTSSPFTYGIYSKSIVWQFFVKGIKTFNGLNWNPAPKA